MARTAIATLQPVWDCRWSRPGHRLDGVTEALQPESRWVCVRETHRHNVTDDQCQTCAHWEMSAEAYGGDTLVASPAGAALVATPVVATPAIAEQVLVTSMRAVMAMTAALLFGSGFAVLTGPLMIPVTVSLWMCAAGLVGLAAFGRFGDHGAFIAHDVH
jgi:hypothetical protein